MKEGKEMEIVSLEDIVNILTHEARRLKNIKEKLDEIAGIIEKVDSREKDLSEKAFKVEELNKKLLLYFEGSNAYENLQLVNQNLKEIKSEYEGEVSSFNNKIMDVEFNESRLKQYSEDAISFISDKIRLIEEIDAKQREIFNNAMEELKDKINVVSRLLNALMRRAENVQEKYDVKIISYLDNEKSRIQQLQGKLPWDINDFYKKYKEANESLKGLYIETKDIIAECKERLRRTAIENKFLEEDEINVLEIIYMMTKKEFEFNEVINYIKGKIPEKEEKEIQRLLINLSEKGFLTIKLIAE